MLDSAWSHFRKQWSSWVFLVTTELIAFLLTTAFVLYCVPVLLSFVFLLKGLFIAVLYQNGLDAVYGRKLTLLKVTPLMLFASLIFLALESYVYVSGYLDLLLSAMSMNSQLLFVINWGAYILALYLAMRCMFMGIILLEEKSSVLEAFQKSLKLTANNASLSFGVFVCLEMLIQFNHSGSYDFNFIASFSSTLAIVARLTILILALGSYIIFPCMVLVKSLLYKQISGDKK